jgi:hypothetical protein
MIASGFNCFFFTEGDNFIIASRLFQGIYQPVADLVSFVIAGMVKITTLLRAIELFNKTFSQRIPAFF